MVACAPIPPDDTARLEALHAYQVLDTPADDRFDLFTRLSTWLYDVPLSAINLVDADRTFFKSLIGMDSYTPRRATSLCAHAVGEGEPIMVVEDLLADERFRDHPLAVTKGFRFYAGAVLRSDTGHALGTICICDWNPRSFTEAEREKLIELGRGVSAVLELHRANLRLREAASRDMLTGLFNRRAFTDALHEAVSSERRPGSCALLYLDLDRFKHVNDTFGHAGGDALLREVAARLSAAIVGPDMAARLGGDEFVVLLRDDTTARQAELIAARILAAFAEPFALDGRDVRIQGSIGVATCPGDASDADALVRCADIALYEAKRSGRGRVGRFAEQRRARPAPVGALV